MHLNRPFFPALPESPLLPPPQKKKQQRAAPGLAARDAAARAIALVLDQKRGLDDAFDTAMAETPPLEPRDRALARLIVLTVLRRRGELYAVTRSFMDREPPKDSGRLWPILMSAAAQVLILDTPPHAAISLAVDLCRANFRTRHFDKLANAVLRKVATQGRDVMATLDAEKLNTPPMFWSRWTAVYGEETARAIAKASLIEAPLDLTPKADAAALAERLSGELLPTGSVRIANSGRVEDFDGFSEGLFWVQDAAAALPAKLLGAVEGQEVLDICAAPGGKTAQLANQGARVTALDISEKRLSRVSENLKRLKLSATLVSADAATWQPDHLFDAILLDAPCTATGTIRRHPDILHVKREEDFAKLAAEQARILAHAATLLKPGGRLVYCTCSLEPEEGSAQIEKFLAANPGYVREPILPGEAGIEASWLTSSGDLRTRPDHGLDGFYAARLRRTL